MGIEITCDGCSAAVGDMERIACTKCAKTTCSICKMAADELICRTCGEIEFDDDDVREPNEEDLADFIEHHVSTEQVHDLAAAIRRGDTVDAEHLLDQIASYVPSWADAVSLGRFSWRAKAAA